MPRGARVYLPGLPLHVIQRGNDRATLFRDTFDFDCYLSYLAFATRRYCVAVHAYVLMSNHVHMLVTPAGADSLGRAMRWIGAVFVQNINIRHGQTGSRLEGRYKTRAIEDEAYFLACMRYIEQNPVRAGMVVSPRDYRWSSYHANALGADDGLVTRHPIYHGLGMSREERAAQYRSLFMNPLSEGDIQLLRMPVQRRGRRPKRDGACNGVRP